MSRFDDCLRFVLTEEGGFSDDPADPGGATNRGITQKTYDTWRTVQGLPVVEVKSISEAEVATIYKEQYWDAARCGQLPAPLDLLQFDTAVQSGVATAGRFLQAAVGMTVVDGVVGKATLAAVAQADPIAAAMQYAVRRLIRYAALMRGPEAKFGKGWIHRIGALCSAV